MRETKEAPCIGNGICEGVTDAEEGISEFLRELRASDRLAELVGIGPEGGRLERPDKYLRTPEESVSGIGINTDAEPDWFCGEIWPKEYQ